MTETAVRTPGFDDPVSGDDSGNGLTSLAPPRPVPVPVSDKAAKQVGERVNRAVGDVAAKRVAESAKEVDRLMRAQGLGASRIAVKRTGPSWLPSDERGTLATMDLAEFVDKGFVETVRDLFGGGNYQLLALGPGDREIDGESWSVQVGGVEPIVTTPMGFAALDRMNERRQKQQGSTDTVALFTALMQAVKDMRPPEPPHPKDGEKSLFALMLEAQRQSEERMRADAERRESERRAEESRRDAERKADEARREAERQAERERDRRDRDDREKERQRQHELELKRMETAAKDPIAGVSMIEKAGSALMEGFTKLARAKAMDPKEAAFDWREGIFNVVRELGPHVINAFPQLLAKQGVAAAAPAPIAPALPAPLPRGAAGQAVPAPTPATPTPRGGAAQGGAVPAGVARSASGPQSPPPALPPLTMSRGAAEPSLPVHIVSEGGPPSITDVPTTFPQEPPAGVDVGTNGPQIEAPPTPDQVALAGIAETLANFVGTIAVAQTRQMKPGRAWLMDEGRLTELLEELPEPMQKALAEEGWEKFASALPADGPGVAEIKRNMETEIGCDWMKRFLAEGPWAWPDEDEEDAEETEA